ncbi:tyrosine-type recombinase/integrase [Candidatus Woesearchaeota archaeon]|nr:tyrosine-type recombinase/integrase [Candidatus Woesearchaeota archaeon]
MAGKEGQSIKYLSREEWRRLAVLPLPLRDHLILRVLYETGCTVNELVNITVADLNLRESIIIFPAPSARGHRTRSSFISEDLAVLIRRYLRLAKKAGKAGSFLFDSRQSSQMTTKRIRQLVQAFAKEAGIAGKNNPQILRYSHIVHAYENDVQIDAIEKQVGITRSRAVQIFSELRRTPKKDAYKSFFG